VAEKKPESKRPSSKPKHVAAPKVKTRAASDPMMAPVAATPSVTAIKSSDIGGPVEAPRKPYAPRRTVAYIVGAVVALVVVVLVVFGVLIYDYRSDSPAVRAVSAVIPYPALKVGGNFVSYHEYLFEMASIKQYYQSQSGANGQTPVDFNSASGQKQLEKLRQQILAQLKSDEVTRQLIAQNKIVVTDAELTAQYNQLVKSAGGEAKLKDVLTKVYGWNVADLKAKLKFQLQTQALAAKIASNPTTNAQAQAQAQSVLSQLKAGGDFAALAKKYSQNSSAANGGDLGFVSKGQTGDTVLEATAFGQTAGQVSGVVKTQFGYEIVKTIAFNADKTQVHAAEILIKPIDFNDYLSQKIAQTKSTIYIKQ
jgi:parvulin-like peptidyl-prolyl isomerase